MLGVVQPHLAARRKRPRGIPPPPREWGDEVNPPTSRAQRGVGGGRVQLAPSLKQALLVCTETVSCTQQRSGCGIGLWAGTTAPFWRARRHAAANPRTQSQTAPRPVCESAGGWPRAQLAGGGGP